MDTQELPDDVETGDASPPIAASYLVRVTMRGHAEPPTNAQVEQAIAEVLGLSDLVVSVSSERTDR